MGEVAGRGCSTKEKMYYVHCEVSIMMMMMVMMVMMITIYMLVIIIMINMMGNGPWAS